MYNMYYENGVLITPNVLAEGDMATVKYKGLLFKSGAHSVYMHMGSGSKWKNTKDIHMKRTADGFEANIPITCKDSLNLAFKDCASNWDNNSGKDYTFEVQERNL